MITNYNKFFESETIIRLPQKVSESDFFEKRGKFRMMEWTDNEHKVLFRILDGKRDKNYGRFSFSFSSDFLEMDSNSGCFYGIIKLDGDWFTIIKQYNKGLYGGVSDEYFIADEFEEVVNFLNRGI